MNLKPIICTIRGHDLEERSFIPFRDSQNWLKKCRYCGMYQAHSRRGVHLITEDEAYRWYAECLLTTPDLLKGDPDD